jgi:hypothetical protein
MYKNLESLILYHRKLHPSLTVQDIYKLLFQSTMGPAHIMKNKDKAISLLNQELNSLDLKFKKNEILVEPISIDEKVVRINLRPFKRKMLDVKLLFYTIEKTSGLFVKNQQKLDYYWETFKQLVQEKKLDFDSNNILSLEKRLSSQHNGLLTHSRIYRHKEKPSYRVVLIDIFKKLFTK